MRHFLPVLLIASGLVPACGEVVPLEEQACPCASGWTCCDAVCVVGTCEAESDPKAACSSSVALGSWSVPGDSDAASAVSAETVVGQIAGSLSDTAPTAFDYALSVWPTPYGFRLNGWTLHATAGEVFTFTLWADEDAGAVALPLVVYGPVKGMDSGACSAPLQGSGPLSGSTIAWTAPVGGTYFVASFHAVSETPAGLAFQGLNDPSLARAFIATTSAAHAD